MSSSTSSLRADPGRGGAPSSGSLIGPPQLVRVWTSTRSRSGGGGGAWGPGPKVVKLEAARKVTTCRKKASTSISRQNSRSRSGVFRSKLNLPIPIIGDCNLARSHPLQAVWCHIWVGRRLHDPLFGVVAGCTTRIRVGYRLHEPFHNEKPVRHGAVSQL